MRVEVVAARGQLRKEGYSRIARRLGVHRDTAVRWEAEWREAEEAGTAPSIPSHADLQRGRWVRVTQVLDDAPFVVGPLDEEWFVRASVGEMRHFMRRRSLPWMEEVSEDLERVLDRVRPMLERRRELERLGGLFATAFETDPS